MAKRRRPPSYAELAKLLGGKLRPPFGVVLGSPNEVLDLAAGLPAGDVVCYQMDLHQADKLRLGFLELGLDVRVAVLPDLWDLASSIQTLFYPVPLGGERALKLDMVEQAYHVLAPQGTFVVLSPYEKDDFFPQTMKKIFGRVHSPMGARNAVLWATRGADKNRRRHEITFQVRVDETTSYRFVSRPGVFSYGKFDDGARALTEAMEVNPGDRVLDLGCGVGTNGILAARRAGPGGAVTFADSNVRAIALAELNARALQVPAFDTRASFTMKELREGSYDVVLANPPYYAQLTIAQLFVQRGWQCLKRGGRLFLVTKQPDILYPVIEDAFGEPEMEERRGYFVFSAHRKR